MLKKASVPAQYHFLFNIQNEDEVVKQLEKDGWKEHSPSWSSGTHYYTSPCKLFFVKYSYISDDGRDVCGIDVLPKYAVPTVFLTPTDKKGYGWRLQRRASITEKAKKKATDFFQGLKHGGTDLHGENVGIYRGKPVVIDW